MKRLILLIIGCIIAFGQAATAQEWIVGPWNGEIKIANQSLPLVIHISDNDGTLEAAMDSPMQGAKDIPAAITVSSDSTVTIQVTQIGAKYEGTYRNDVISGTLHQSGLSLPLNLKRGEYEIPRPQTPEPPYPYETREITFTNPADSAVLAGTLTLPVFYQMSFSKDIPLVVMVTGSGQQNRDEEILRHKPFAVLAHHLAVNGIASLRYDDRGFAQSTGDAANATTATFKADAKAAIDYAKGNVAKIGKIGVLGHSEGGEIAYMLAADGDADFIISIAGPALTGTEVLKWQNRVLLEKALAPQIVDDYIKALDIVFDFMVKNPEAREYPGLDAQLAQLPKLTPELKSNLHLIIEKNSPWLTYFLAYDPAEDIAKIGCPTMGIFGELDMQVDADSNMAALQSLLPAATPSNIKTYPSLNHLMQHASTGHPSEYATIQETISPEILNDIVVWIQEISKVKR